MENVPLEYRVAVSSFLSMLTLSNEVQTFESQHDRKAIIEAENKETTSFHGDESIPITKPPPYQGDILENPELLWSEDLWNEEREADARSRLLQQGDNMPIYWKKRYETKAGVYWHEFYKRNEDNFYKDRHYLHIVFPELLSNCDKPVESQNSYTLLEVGCGVGNAVIPLVELNPNMNVVAMDFANSAIQILRQHSTVSCDRVRPFVNDVVRDSLPVSDESVDGILCMFVVSAIPPEEHRQVFTKLFKALKPGGKLFFRDYGRYAIFISKKIDH